MASDTISTYIITFNCARETINPNSFANNFFDALPSDEAIPDLIAISLQEFAPIAYSFLGGWLVKQYFDEIENAVIRAGSNRNQSVEIKKVYASHIGMTALMIFAKENLVPLIKDIQASEVGVGLMGMGNKGAIAARVGIGGPIGPNLISNSTTIDDNLEITFVAAHLAPMESEFQRRNLDFENIVRNIALPYQRIGLNDHQDSSKEPSTLIDQSDTVFKTMYETKGPVFFAGDLNYRTSDIGPTKSDYQTYPDPRNYPNTSTNTTVLLEKDQLRREMDSGRAFHGFNEAPVSFPPTYKYKTSPNISSDNWQWASHRFPSWCDRILFLNTYQYSHIDITKNAYTCLPLQPSSDHRPVALYVKIKKLRTGKRSPNSSMNVMSSPFTLDKNIVRNRKAARRREILVGIVSYLGLTREGNSVLVSLLGFTGVLLWFFSSNGNLKYSID